MKVAFVKVTKAVLHICGMWQYMLAPACWSVLTFVYPCICLSDFLSVQVTVCVSVCPYVCSLQLGCHSVSKRALPYACSQHVAVQCTAVFLSCNVQSPLQDQAVTAGGQISLNRISATYSIKK